MVEFTAGTAQGAQGAAGDGDEGCGRPPAQRIDFPAAARAAAVLPAYAASHIPADVRAGLSERLYDVAAVLPGFKSYVQPHVPAGMSVDEFLWTSWRAALAADALRMHGDKLIFPLPVMRADGETPIEISLVPNDRPNDRPWFAKYVDTAVRSHVPREVSPSRAIEEFAYFGYWDTFLAELAELALPESWSFEDDAESEGRRHPILKSYVANVYYRLEKEGKVCVSDDGSFAAFNTGLVDRRYNDIYLCFEPNIQVDRCPWRFVGFCVQGVGRLGKRLVNEFNPLPATATFFERKEDLLFDLDAELIINYDHVLVDNIDRLPVEFIREGMHADAAALDTLDKLESASASGPERQRLYGMLREQLESNHAAFRYLRVRLDEAVQLTRKRVRWNYKTAIPMYYPRANTMSLLLPLCLMDESEADAALVVERMDSGNYQGQTVLTMRMAYMDARLVCRPDSDWLTTE